MTAAFKITVLGIILVAPSPCFALWDIVDVSKELAKELGMEIRSTGGPKLVQVELAFKIDGNLKDFTGVDLRIGKGDNTEVAVSLKEDRSKPGQVAVSFIADPAQLDKLTLEMRVPYRGGALGGAVYKIRVKDFVELKKAR